jgi:hypothetical protein
MDLSKGDGKGGFIWVIVSKGFFVPIVVLVWLVLWGSPSSKGWWLSMCGKAISQSRFSGKALLPSCAEVYDLSNLRPQRSKVRG